MFVAAASAIRRATAVSVTTARYRPTRPGTSSLRFLFAALRTLEFRLREFHDEWRALVVVGKANPGRPHADINQPVPSKPRLTVGIHAVVDPFEALQFAARWLVGNSLDLRRTLIPGVQASDDK